jgi:hypothetical protein
MLSRSRVESVEGRFNLLVGSEAPFDVGVLRVLSGVFTSLFFVPFGLALTVDAAVARANDGTAILSLTPLSRCSLGLCKVRVGPVASKVGMFNVAAVTVRHRGEAAAHVSTR